MRKGGSKQKGSQFEREIAEKLSRWATFGDRSDVFWRSSMSGGRATVARKRGKLLQAQTGDLSAIHSLGEPFLNKFYVELKFYRDLNYSGLITGKGHLVEFWKSTVTEANCYNKCPLLIAKQNRLPTMVFTREDGLRMLAMNPGQCWLTAIRLGMIALPFDYFVEHARPL